MRVRNVNMPLGEVIDLEGNPHQGDAFGVYDVPEGFGNWLCGTPGWEPEAGASLGEVVSRPDGMSEEDHARQLAEEAAAAKEAEEAARAAEIARLAAEDKAAADAAKKDVGRADDSERQVADSKPTPPPAPPAPPAPSESEAEAEAEAEAGPDLSKMTKAELLKCAEEYSAKGYEIEVSDSMHKGDIRSALSKALYGE